MNRVTTVGELRAVLAGLPDNAVLRPAINRFVARPGLYVIRYAEGTCNAAYAEVQIEGHVAGMETINIVDDVRAQYERTLETVVAPPCDYCDGDGECLSLDPLVGYTPCPKCGGSAPEGVKR